ncbi:MAG TPA: adenylate/guanylate cyclase domain-containing protein [Ramlibacter sp.]|nr:adenylate/guanylate cyclase domain-containing protein [Ramlibacter sp.]
MFADIVGSTELVAHLDPEQAMDLLRPAVLRMRASVERFGGTVVRTLGDGVMAVFGVPRALEGHALLACEAALHMQEAFKASPDGLSIRIGLHSGQVASDPEDAHGGHGGGAHGVTIHLASRVVALAEPGGICLTQACRTLAGPGCETQSRGRHQLKGIPGPVEILTLTHVRATAPYGAGGELGLTTFRGRQGELANLIGALEQLEDGLPQVLAIAGDAGAGKSRLCHEFARLCTGRGIPVFEVRAQLHGDALPLQPILELFRVHFFGIGAGDSPASARARIANRFLAKPLAEADLALLYEFFGVADPGASPLNLGPRAGHARRLALIAELVRQESDTTRVILIEDLHWLDQASAEFVSALVDAVPGTRTLLLLNYRTSYRPPWSEVSYFRQLELGELPAADMDALVGGLLAPLSRVPAVCGLVVRRSGGNPFFAEELVRTLAETGALSADTGQPLGGMEAVERALPATVQAVIGARLDRVGEPEKTLLQMCAIIGKEIPLAVLEHVASPLASRIERGLEGLCRAGLILPQPSKGGRRLAFRHPLIQEVAYGTQLKVRREKVHASVAAAMELYYADQVDEYAGLIAYHFEQAGQFLPGARYSARAANWAASSDSRRAMNAWRKVRELVKRTPASPEGDSLMVLAFAKSAWLSWREGTPMGEVLLLIEAARQIAGSRDARIIRLLLFLEGRMLQANGGSVDRYAELVSEALSTMEPDASLGSKVLLNIGLCQAYGWAGMFDKALQASDAALAGIDVVDKFEEDFIGYSLKQWLLVLRGRVLARLGRLDEAARCLDEVLALPPHTVDPVLLEIAHYGMAEVACAAEDIERAEHHRRTVAGIAGKHDNAYLSCFAHACGALVDHARGQLLSAISGFRQALEMVRRHNVAKEFETELLACLAECCYAVGDLRAAEGFCEEAIVLSRDRSNRHQHVRALVIASEVLRAKGTEADRREAADLLQRARTLVQASGASALAFRVKALPEIVLG